MFYKYLLRVYYLFGMVLGVGRNKKYRELRSQSKIWEREDVVKYSLVKGIKYSFKIYVIYQ